MRRLKAWGALLSAAALIAAMPLTAFGASASDEPEKISTSGWVEVSNAHPSQGDVISLTISLRPSAGYKGISGRMQSVTGAEPAVGPESTAAPTVVPTAAPTAATTVTAPPAVSAAPPATQTPASVSPSAAPSVSASQTVTPSASAETPVPSASASHEAPASEAPSASSSVEAPTEEPSATEAPSAEPSATEAPSAEPSATEAPSAEPSATEVPSAEPSESVSESPSAEASGSVSSVPSADDTARANTQGDGWNGLLSDDNLFIVLEDAPDCNVATRYFKITGEPGSTVVFNFSGRYSDGVRDHRFTATHEFQISSGVTEITKSIDAGSQGRISTTKNSDLNFRVWPSFTTIEGVRAASTNTKGTSPGELLKNLALPQKTMARVYNGDSNKPRLSAVCTGDTVRFTENVRGRTVDAEAVVVVRGDLLGTGKLGLNQLVAMSKTLAGELPVTEATLQAADVNGDGEVTSRDATALKRLLLNR